MAIAAGIHHSLALADPVPALGSSPETQTAEAGSTVVFCAGADDYWPLTYHWAFDGTNVLGSNADSLLALTNIQPSQAGLYVAVITSSYGAVTSQTATLSIIAPVPKRTVPALSLTGDVGSFLHVDYADTLGHPKSWQTLGAVTLTNTPQLYLDLSDQMPPQRFYRAWQANVPSVLPALSVGMAEEITLTGGVGSKVRVDYINQFGPIDAWVTLDTVTLTNTTQPYLDLGMWRQPARLYRLVPVP
jgi:hypothetical protein